MKLSQDSVTRLKVPAGKPELLVFDDALPGFGARIREGGSRTWIVQYQIGPKQRRVSLGAVAGQPADKARKAAGTLLARVRLGEDPQADKLKARATAGVTLGSVIERFVERKRQTLRPRTLVELERHLREDWKPLHQLQIGNVDRSMVASRLVALAGESASAADHARASLSTLFTWAVKEGLVDANPVAATNRPSEPLPRDRVLTDSELQEIWNASGDNDYGRIVRLLILTGQRREEIAALEWSEIDQEKALISLAGSRTKNGRPHYVPLSDPAIELLPSRRADRELIFGDGAGPFSGFSAAKRKLDGRIAAARRAAKAKPMADWRLHDLRRTAATRMADLGVQPHVIEAVLNHVSGHRAGVAGIYNRAVYAAEKRAALVLWGEHVISLASGKGIVVPQANFVTGYPMKEQSPVTVQIGNRSFTMFSKADSAWLVNKEDEAALLAAMKDGSSMVVRAVSQRGSETTYHYSLSGVTAAANKMIAECK